MVSKVGFPIAKEREMIVSKIDLSDAAVIFSKPAVHGGDAHLSSLSHPPPPAAFKRKILSSMLAGSRC